MSTETTRAPEKGREARSSGGRPAAKKKKKTADGRFPVGGLILSFVLIAVAVFAVYEGMIFRDRVTAFREYYDGAVEMARGKLDEAQRDFALADPDSDAHAAERRDVTEQMLTDAGDREAQLRQHNEELDAAIEELETRIKEYAQAEDFDYYKAVYDKYKEGSAYVEELLSGN